MRIGIDISRTIEESTGVGYYAKHLVSGLAKVDPDNDYLLYGIFYDCHPRGWKNASIPPSSNFRLHQRESPSWLVRRQWINFGHYKEKLLGGIDLLHSTAYTLPPVSDTNMIVTIHDLSCFVLPQFHTSENCQFVTRNVHHASRRARFIIADSESTKREVKRFLHVPDEKIEVIYLAAAESFYREALPSSITKVKKTYRITKPYFLAVGSLEPRKNLSRALIAFKALIETGKVDYQFVIAGGKGWKNESFDTALKRLNIDDRLVVTGYVAEEDLLPLYQGADVFLYPSLYEGFGLPVLEAMASGVPVVTSNTSSLPEVAGDAALLVKPMEVFDIYEAMEALATRPDLREECRRKGFKRSRIFTWEETARKTLTLYQKVLGEAKN